MGGPTASTPRPSGGNTGLSWADRSSYCVSGVAGPGTQALLQAKGAYVQLGCRMPLGTALWVLTVQAGAYFALAVYLDQASARVVWRGHGC